MTLRTKEEIVGQLKTGIVNVTFTKVDGTERVMRCTLMEELLPVNLMNGEEQMAHKPRPENPNTVSVYDIEVKDWRSFRVASIKEFNLET